LRVISKGCLHGYATIATAMPTTLHIFNKMSILALLILLIANFGPGCVYSVLILWSIKIQLKISLYLNLENKGLKGVC